MNAGISLSHDRQLKLRTYDHTMDDLKPKIYNIPSDNFMHTHNGFNPVFTTLTT